MLFIADILGTVAFAISGALAAYKRKLDVFGIFIIAFVTAVGGGTLRDVMIGNVPVFWMQNLTYVYLIGISVVLAIIFREKINYLRKTLFLFDTIGIGLYTVIGVEKGIAIGLHPIICISIGTMSACFGGVIRDILCNEVPVIFRKNIYASACIAGGVFYFVFSKLPIPEYIIFFASGAVVILIRLLAVIFSWQLPNIYKSKNTQ